MSEASYIIKKKEDDYIDDWNRTRWNVWATIQSQSSATLEQTDVMKFPWDEPEESKEIEEIDIEQTKEYLSKLSEKMEKKLNK